MCVPLHFNHWSYAYYSYRENTHQTVSNREIPELRTRGIRGTPDPLGLMGWTLEESNRPTVLQFSRISLDFPRIVSSVHYQAVIGILKQFENMK